MYMHINIIRNVRFLPTYYFHHKTKHTRIWTMLVKAHKYFINIPNLCITIKKTSFLVVKMIQLQVKTSLVKKPRYRKLSVYYFTFC